jgi:hypothetical protein
VIVAATKTPFKQYPSFSLTVPGKYIQKVLARQFGIQKSKLKMVEPFKSLTPDFIA